MFAKMRAGIKRVRKSNRRHARDRRDAFGQHMAQAEPERIPEWKIDRSGWSRGPWDNEPDRVEWRDKETGLPCLIVRNTLGAWCGYAGVAPGHQLFGVDSDNCGRIMAHGGITYSDICRAAICHVPQPGEPPRVWWLGFDCSHSGDYQPGFKAMLQAREQYDHRAALKKVATDPYWWATDVYRDQAYVTAEVESLASQLAAYRPTKSVSKMRQYRKRYIRRGNARRR
jgi:hypothetical protein